MAKTRLNNMHRDWILQFATKQMEAKKNPAKIKYENALRKIRRGIQEAIDEAIPGEEMLVLRKFRVLDKKDCLRLVFDDGKGVPRALTFSFWDFRLEGARLNFELPRDPDTYKLKVSKELMQLVESLDELKVNSLHFVNQPVHDLAKFLKTCVYFEDVTDVITVSQEIASRITQKASTQLMVRSPELIKSIIANFDPLKGSVADEKLAS